MYSHVLIPIVFDHVETSVRSLEVAQDLLNETGKITLLHVIEELPSYASTFLPEGLAQTQQQDALKSLAMIAQTSNATCETAVTQGHASSCILSFGKAHAVDCIVIASHKPGIEDYFLGSTAARVVRHAQCGVHVLR
ncbi:MAG: universal stress protein [Roseobacter sp.]